MKRAWLKKTKKDMYPDVRRDSEFHEWKSSSSKYEFRSQQVDSNLK
jgi:hypothetical protein